jgi:hypothetical protein
VNVRLQSDPRHPVQAFARCQPVIWLDVRGACPRGKLVVRSHQRLHQIGSHLPLQFREPYAPTSIAAG